MRLLMLLYGSMFRRYTRKAKHVTGGLPMEEADPMDIVAVSRDNGVTWTPEVHKYKGEA